MYIYVCIYIYTFAVRADAHIHEFPVRARNSLSHALLCGVQIPTNGAEAFMMALSTRDAGGLWFAISSGALVGGGAVLGLSLLLRLVHGTRT